MVRLILIKHATPAIDPATPSAQWRLRPYGVAALVSSTEPKASQTAAEIGGVLGLPHREAPGLHEHDRSNVPHMRSAEFISLVELFFRRPDERVLGLETARAACDRFADAVAAAVADHAAHPGTLAIVTHGTVLSLLLARHNPDHDGFTLWRQMGLPSYAVVSLPGYTLQELADRP